MIEKLEQWKKMLDRAESLLDSDCEEDYLQGRVINRQVAHEMFVAILDLRSKKKGQTND